MTTTTPTHERVLSRAYDSVGLPVATVRCTCGQLEERADTEHDADRVFRQHRKPVGA